MRFRVYGEPKGQPRTKATIRGHHAAVYTPSTADEWKLAIIAAWREVAGPRWEPVRGAVSLEVALLMPRPARLLTRKAPPERLPHIGKPDIDNAAKAVLDALTMAGAWVDDALVASLTITTQYAATGEAPGAEIALWATS
jgi:crossover junction endodeoxyribonuclease RusA